MGIRYRLSKFWNRFVDPRRVAELADERVVFHRLDDEGFFKSVQRARILEIGPKHGQDSALLATLNPIEFVLIDLPEKTPLVRHWLDEVSSRCPTRYIEANVLYMSPQDLERLGAFDMIWALGVLYHNVEQVRLLRRLFDLCAVNGRIVIESATVRSKKLAGLNIVEVHWPNPYRGVPTMTHLPSRRAIKSWLEMVGFTEVEVKDVYSKALGWQRAVLSGVKRAHASPYRSYLGTGLNPDYVAGDAS